MHFIRQIKEREMTADQLGLTKSSNGDRNDKTKQNRPSAKF